MAKKKEVLRYQFRDENGKRYSVTGKTQKELMDRVEKKKKELKRQNKITKEMSVIRWRDEWLETYKRENVTSETFANYKYILNHLNLTMPIKDVKPAHLQKVLNELAGKSNSLIKKLNVLMREMFECAVDNGLCLSNPARKLTAPKGTTKKRRALTAYEREILLLTAEESEDANYIYLMLFCGLRPSEAGRVQGWDIDKKKKLLHVRGTKTDAADRFVPIPDILIRRLSDLAPEEYAVTDTYGRPTTRDSRRNIWKRFYREMNIMAGCEMGRPKKHSPHDQPIGTMPISKEVTAYMLRHTYCTDLERAGVPINVARDLMGHANITITSQIYTHRTDEALSDAAEKINAWSESVSKRVL